MDEMQEYADNIASAIENSNVVLVVSTLKAGNMILDIVQKLMMARGFLFKRYGADTVFVDGNWIRLVTHENEHEKCLGLRDYMRFDYRFDTRRRYKNG